MHRPNLIGDWQEADGDLTGLRVRVHSLTKGDVPADGRDSDAKGLTYLSFRVMVENRAEKYFYVEIERFHLDVRAGEDGDEAFIDYNSKAIEGAKLYPLRRASATFHAAAPAGTWRP